MHFTLANEKVKKIQQKGSSLGFMSILLDHEGTNLLANNLSSSNDRLSCNC
ncbi:hypothetical protein [Candidatus Nitrosocosmicus sp. R]